MSGHYARLGTRGLLLGAKGMRISGQSRAPAAVRANVAPKPRKAGLSAVPDTERTGRGLSSDIIDLFPIIQIPH